GLAGLILGLAETARRDVAGPAASPSLVFLGAASYALYMIHLPVDILYFHGLEKFGVDANAAFAVRVAALAGVFVVAIAGAALAYLLIEEPARKLVRRLSWPKAFVRPLRARA